MLIRAITITSRKVLDKYTIYFWDGSYLSLSSNPDSPQGVSMWGDTFEINDADCKTGKLGYEKMINFFELPAVVQSHVERRIADLNKSGD